MQQDKALTVIISRTDSIGDVMLTLPLAGIIKKHFPQSTIIFLGRNYTKDIIESCIHVDRFVSWDDLKTMDDGDKIKVLKELKADAILHVFPDIAIASLARRAGIPLRAGTSHRFFHLLSCNRLINFSRKNSDLHEAQLNLKLLLPLGIREDLSLKQLHEFTGFTRLKPLSREVQELISDERYKVILHPRSKGSAREWGLANFTSLIRLLPADKFRVFISGTAAEGESMKDFIRDNPSAKSLCGKLSLSEFIGLIAKSNALVAASTGPLHIASALEKKALGLFAPMKPIHPGRWAPIGPKAEVLVKNVDCSDCRKTADCHCIREITPEEVASRLMCDAGF